MTPFECSKRSVSTAHDTLSKNLDTMLSQVPASVNLRSVVEGTTDLCANPSFLSLAVQSYCRDNPCDKLAG